MTMFYPDDMDPFLVVGRLPSGVLFLAIEEVVGSSVATASVEAAVGTALRFLAEARAAAQAVERGLKPSAVGHMTAAELDNLDAEGLRVISGNESAKKDRSSYNR